MSSAGECLLEWDSVDGAKSPVPLLKDMFGSERRKAKVLNFSIAYGKTAHGLSRDWGTSLDEAKDTVDRWYSDRPEVFPPPHLLPATNPVTSTRSSSSRSSASPLHAQNCFKRVRNYEEIQGFTVGHWLGIGACKIWRGVLSLRGQLHGIAAPDMLAIGVAPGASRPATCLYFGFGMDCPCLLNCCTVLQQVEEWQKMQRKLAEHAGYVCTILGRRRLLPDASSNNQKAKVMPKSPSRARA